MPIYEYECPKCGRFDVLQKMSAAPLEVHEACGSAVHKLMSASSFAFKGSGFYQTDYGKKHVPDKESKGSDKSKSSEKPACAAASESCGGCAGAKPAAA
jgi:putative FmdB family regulatory protein